MKQLPGDSSAEPQEPPSPWWHLHKWAPVHLAVLGVSLLVLLGVVIARLDVYEWRKHHVPQADYETFQYPCQAAGQKLLLYCWPGAPVDVRIEDLLSRLSTEEKIGFLTNTALGVPRLAIPAYQWWNEALHGVAVSAGVVFAAPTPAATSFPQVIGTSSSFNRSLWRAIGAAVSREARAFNNAGHAGLTFWAPNLNVFRDPRWGRGQETPGEDPLLTGDYASAFVSAMQSGSRFAAPATGTDLPGSNVATSRLGGGQLAVSACCKHFDAYSLENWDGVERYGFDALVDAQDLADTYLPAFRECVVTGGASCIMCAYNAVNGVPMCANKPFLTDLARGAWGFDGYITSDCDAVMNVWDAHNYTQTLTEAVGQVMRAGMDIDCGSAMDVGTMYEALSEGQVSEHMVDIALRRLLKVQFRLGMFDPAKEQPLRSVPSTAAASASHGHLALDAARQSLVLLKNDDSTLPITVAAGGRHVLKAAKGAAKQVAAPSIAVIGPHGNASSALQSNYFGVAPYLVTPLQGVQGYAPSATYAAGCSSVLCPNTTGFAAATALAAKADIVLLFMGLDLTVEREGQDRVSIALPGMQPQLIDAVIAAAPPTSTVVLILLSGGCVDISAQLANERIGAVLWAGYPGQEGGTAIADALFVAANGPSGRLTQTWYPASYVNEVSMTDMGMRPNASNSNPGRGYRFFTGTPVLPFGWGLTYSTFTVAWGSTGPPSTTMPMSSLEQWLPALRIDAQAAVAGGNPAQGNWPQMPPVSRASVVVTNSGPYAGSRIVLAFMVPPPHAVSAYGAPQKFLVWYGKTDVLRPGKSATLDFLITPKHLSFVAPDGLPATMTGNWSLQIDGGIVDNLVSTFAVTGASKNVVVESTATEAQYAAADTYWATMSPAHLD